MPTGIRRRSPRSSCPVAAVLPSRAFDIAWVGLEILCLLWIARWRPLVALALVVFLPIAVELSFSNVHLILAALIVLGLRRWPWAFAIGAAIKLAPGLGILYFLLRRRWRDAGDRDRRRASSSS